MTTWQQGRAAVDGLIQRREIEKVPASQEAAYAELEQARRHLRSARLLADSDPAGAYTLAYDAARKSLAAVLQNQGLRATSRGGHIAVYEALLAQLDPPLGPLLRPYNRMRARRNEVEYSSSEAPSVDAGEVGEVCPKVEKIIELAEKVIPRMGRY
ncbi:HEPN domain-containing protein [Streptomyces sp. LHD-70]|uniref:HEPN domain-containing protein n=1 Tax=Streptomyces sp. LHD-70 TaxID=3072140 RepID=UPI00280FCB3D|nr:HEPN domain-containing protein [Streptomyces sp. LHD-70]MDQ8707268.1 HEPN domain-containing protein [Streptomyces sp. LHD-70]